MKKACIALAVLIIVGGTALLLQNLRVLPEVDWLWTGLLAASGLLILMMFKLNKLSFVFGPFLLVNAVLFVLTENGQLSRAIQLPVLVIVFGTLLLLAVVSPIPMPRSLMPEERDRAS